MLGKLMLLGSGAKSSTSWFLSNSATYLSSNTGFSNSAIDKDGTIYSLVSGITTSYIEKISSSGESIFNISITQAVGKIAVSKNFIFTLSDLGYAVVVSKWSKTGTLIGSVNENAPQDLADIGAFAVNYDDDKVYVSLSGWTDLIEDNAYKSFIVNSSGAKEGLFTEYYTFTSGYTLGCMAGTDYLSRDGTECIVRINSSAGNFTGQYLTSVSSLTSTIDDVASDGTYIYIAHGRDVTFSYITKINHSTKAVVWHKKITHPVNAVGKKIALDSAGNLYILLPKYHAQGLYLIKIAQSTYQTATVEWTKLIYCSVSLGTYYNWYTNLIIDPSTNDIFIKQRNSDSSGFLYLRLVASNIPIGTYTVYTPNAATLTISNTSITVADIANYTGTYTAGSIVGTTSATTFGSGIATTSVASKLNTRTLL